MNRRIAFWLIVSLPLLAVLAKGAPSPASQWRDSIKHTLDFFDRVAWDEKSGSYHSEIDVDGKPTSEARHLVATSRLVYGLAHGNRLDRAKRLAEFLSKHFVRTDAIGPYFLSAVDASGRPLAEKTILAVHEQAYGIHGLVALYSRTSDAALLKEIREHYTAFRKRFYDEKKRGFFDGYDLKTGQPVRTKSYNSTVYVATAFLLELYQAAPEMRIELAPQLSELGDLVVRHFVDQKTGWIVEQFDANWKPNWREWQKQGEFTIGVVGHNFQAAWLLMRLDDAKLGSTSQRKSYLEAARFLIASMIFKGGVDFERGGVFDVFKRETSEPMWHTNKAWWQQAEAILALQLADRKGVLKSAQARTAREKTIAFYFKSFVDKDRGGEYSEVDRDGKATKDAVKGNAGKSAYHTVELARYMMKY